MASSSSGDNRRVVQSYLGTTVFCTVIALVLWGLGVAQPLWASFVISFSIGYSISTSSWLLAPHLERVLTPVVSNAITTAFGLLVGLLLAGLLAMQQPFYFLADNDYSPLILGLFFGVIGFTLFRTQDRLHDAETQLKEAQTRQLEAEKEQLEMQLRVLQAQIEPHFLFNTLSNAIGMIRTQPEAAEQMLVNLTTLFRASLARSREGSACVGDEVEVLEALLDINRLRMGERLRYRVDVDKSIHGLPLPPLLLQPLVENALKHGIEPLEDGGVIDVTGKQQEDQLVFEIRDSGSGPAPVTPAGTPDKAISGTGLANVRGRLQALFGERAKLTLSEADSGGMVATLTLPIPEP